jgi:hypothetical protein
MKMHPLLIAVLVLFVAVREVPGQDAAPTAVAAVPYEDPDAYAIYAVLLTSNNEKVFVIQPEVAYGPDVSDTSIKGGTKFKRVWGAALTDYIAKFHQKRILTPDFAQGFPYRFVTRSELSALNTGKVEESWKNFAAHYPGARGYYYFSAVGFDKRKTHAIVEMNNSCGGLCGYGRPYFLQKKHGKWREVKVDAEYSAWAS